MSELTRAQVAARAGTSEAEVDSLVELGLIVPDAAGGLSESDVRRTVVVRRTGGMGMEWVTREHPHTDRIACPWLVRRFIDREAVITYVPRDEVLAYAARTGAISFDAPGARYTHRDGLCTFEVIVEEHQLGGDPALALVAKVVHGADVSEDADITPESRGLEAIARGFMDLGLTDQEQLQAEIPVYDALYAWARGQVAG